MAELSGQGPIIAPAATSVLDATQRLPLGTRMRDTSGNEYVYVNISDTFGVGQWVAINYDWSATRVANTTRGPIGILTVASTSDKYGWVQIYGNYDSAQIASSSFTSAYWLAGPAGATTASALLASSTDDTANLVYGAWLTTVDNTTDATTPAMTGYRAGVFLNFPYLLATNPGLSTVGSS